MHESFSLGLIGGSAIDALAGFTEEERVECTTAWGEPSAAPRRGRIGALSVLWLARHGEPHAIAPHRVNYRANIAALQQCGATHLLALNTVGGIAQAAIAGTLWLPAQIIDYTWGRAGSYHDGERLPLAHVEFAEPYDATLRTMLRVAAARAGETLHDGAVYGCTQGPRLETAAEIRRLQRDGCDLVGMTAMPEAALARELALPYASIAMVVNRAAGLADAPITLADIHREAAACAPRIAKVVAALADALASRHS